MGRAGARRPRRRLEQYEELDRAGWEKVAAYHAAAHRLVAPYLARHLPFAPAIEDAVLDGLCHAALSWDPKGRHKEFYSWMKTSIFSAVSGAVARERRRRARARRLHAQDLRAARRHNGLDLPSTPTPAPQLFTVAEVKAMARRLRGKHRRLLLMLFVDGLTQAEAATVLCCSTSKTSTLYSEALRQLARRPGPVDRGAGRPYDREDDDSS